MSKVERFFTRYAGRMVVDADIASFLFGFKPTEVEKRRALDLREMWVEGGCLTFIARADQDRRPIFRVNPGVAPGAVPAEPASPARLVETAKPPKASPSPLQQRNSFMWQLEQAAEHDAYEEVYAHLHAKLCKAERKAGRVPELLKGQRDQIYTNAKGAAYRAGTFTVDDMAARLGIERDAAQRLVARMREEGVIETQETRNRAAWLYRWVGR